MRYLDCMVHLFWRVTGFDISLILCFFFYLCRTIIVSFSLFSTSVQEVLPLRHSLFSLLEVVLPQDSLLLCVTASPFLLIPQYQCSDLAGLRALLKISPFSGAYLYFVTPKPLLPSPFLHSACFFSFSNMGSRNGCWIFLLISLLMWIWSLW